MTQAQADLATRQPSELTRDEWQELRDRYGTALGAGRALGCSGSTVVRYWNRHGIAYEHSNVRASDRVRIPTNASGPEYAPLLKLLPKRKAVRSIIDVSNALNCPPREVERLAEAARADGYDVEFGEKSVALRREVGQERPHFVHDFYGEHFRVAIVSDTHFGEIYEAEAEWDQFVELCHKEGIKDLYHAGDITAGLGVYRNQIRDLRPDCIGVDQQAQRAADKIIASNLSWHFILGNHDLRQYEANGFDVGQRICDLVKAAGYRKKVECLGHDRARIGVGKNEACLLDLNHPGGGTAYAISYRSQKIVEEYTSGDKPHIVAIGHFHKMDDLPHTRNMVALQAGCFCWTTRFMGRKQIAPHVGGLILEGWIGKINGKPSLARIRTEWVKFYQPRRGAAD